MYICLKSQCCDNEFGWCIFNFHSSPLKLIEWHTLRTTFVSIDIHDMATEEHHLLLTHSTQISFRIRIYTTQQHSIYASFHHPLKPCVLHARFLASNSIISRPHVLHANLFLCDNDYKTNADHIEFTFLS